MYDAVFVLVEAFNKVLRKKPDLFRNNVRRGINYNETSKSLECNTKGNWVVPWEHGDKISRFLRKVCLYLLRKLQTEIRVLVRNIFWWKPVRFTPKLNKKVKSNHQVVFH